LLALFYETLFFKYLASSSSGLSSSNLILSGIIVSAILSAGVSFIKYMVDEPAALADFVIVLYNPKSKRRSTQLERAQQIILKHRDKNTPVGIVTSAMRQDQEIALTTLEHLHMAPVTMLTTVFIGNSAKFEYQGLMITPRGYSKKYDIRKSPAPCLAVFGTGSDVGKSIVVTALCRIFSNRGIRVAPYKAQNISNNSGVTPEGLEMGRAQIVQAEASRTPPQVD
jgi:hypothetical protein